MNRKDLADIIAEKHDLTKVEAANIINTITDTIAKSIKKKEPVALLGFGTFKPTERAARKGFNPKAQVPIKIAASKSVKFTPGKGFKDLLNPRNAKKAAKKD